MTITFPRDLPDGIRIKTQRFRLSDNQGAFESAFSRQISVQSNGGGTADRWEGVWTTPVLSKDNTRIMSAWMTSLKNRKNTFHGFDADWREPSTQVVDSGDILVGSENVQVGDESILVGRGSTPGIGTVDGAGQTGTSLNTNWDQTNTTVLDTGDYAQVGVQILKALEPVETDGSGDAVFNFEPAMRTVPADGQQILTENTEMVARLAEVFVGWDTNSQKTGVFSFAFEEGL